MANPSALDRIIPPEIKNDPFYAVIEQIARDPNVRTILEIGSSAGEGSTEAFVKGIRAAGGGEKRLFCVEVSRTRHQALARRYAGEAFVHAYNVSAVPAEAFPSEQEVAYFYRSIPSALNHVPLERVFDWLRTDLAYVRESGVPQDGIRMIQDEERVETFDAVLIDGSEFTGSAELDRVIGAGLILLDDIRSFKNHESVQRLSRDPKYVMVAIEPAVRNGYAIFRRRDFAPGQYETIAPTVNRVEGHMVPGQEQFLFHQVRSLPDDAVIVEIGSFKGRSTVAMAHACIGTKRRIYCIDTWDGNESDFAERNFFDAWRQNVDASGLSDYVIPLRGLSHEMLARWHELGSGKPIDFIFIDGSHQFDDVLRDFQMALPLVKTGGWIAFHDVIPTWPGPWRVWNRLARECLEDHRGSSTLACGRKTDATEAKLVELVARPRDPLPVHFFTIVLNGEPFIRHHIEQFKQLPFEWHWHIMEGVAHLRHDTAWSLQSGGRIPDQLHRKGLSADGTTEYLDALVKDYPENVTVYRKPDGFWDGKREMVGAPFMHIYEECLLWEVDVDEIWRAQQIIDAREMFLGNPDRTAAFYLCLYLIGPDRLITSRDGYGNHYAGEWLRTWRYRPGMAWARHEPPILAQPIGNNQWQDVGRIHPFTRDETESAGLVFEHYAYATLPQVLFKQSYYGYSGAVAGWLALQGAGRLPRKVGEFLPWVQDDSVVDSARAVMPNYTFAFPDLDAVKDDKGAVRDLIYVRTDAIGDAILASPTLVGLAGAYRNARITVVCQERVATVYEKCPLVHEVIAFEEERLREREYCDGLWQRLRKINAEVCISSVQSRTNVTDFFMGATGAKERIGLHGDLTNTDARLRDQGDLSYTRFVASPGVSKNEIARQRDLLHGLGIEPGEMSTRMWTGPEDEQAAEALLAQHGVDPARTIVMWCGAQFNVRDGLQIGAAIGEICQANGYRVVALGGEKDGLINQLNLANVPNDSVDLTGKTSIRVAAEIIRRCRLAVGVDTSLGHVACAVGTRNVILLGGGHFGRFMPYSPLTTVVCLPIHCYGCRWICRYEKPYCLRSVEPRVIAVAVEHALAQSDSKPTLFAQDRSLWQGGANRPNWAWFHQYIKRAEIDVATVGVQADGTTRVTPLIFPERHRTLSGEGSLQTQRREVAFALLQTPLPQLPGFFGQRVAGLLEQDPASIPAVEVEAVILDELLAGLARGPGDPFSLYYQTLWMLYLYRSEVPDWCLTNPPEWLKTAILTHSAASRA